MAVDFGRRKETIALRFRHFPRLILWLNSMARLEDIDWRLALPRLPASPHESLRGHGKVSSVVERPVLAIRGIETIDPTS